MEVDAVMHVPTRQVDLQTAKAGDTAHERIDHALNQSTGYRRVDRISAIAQRHGAGFNGLGLRCHNHS